MSKSSSYEILNSTDNSVAKTIAAKVAQGMNFNDIMNHYDLSPENEAAIHEFKSRISEKLRDGVPFAEVIDSVFTDPAIKKEIMAAYHAQASYAK